MKKGFYKISWTGFEKQKIVFNIDFDKLFIGDNYMNVYKVMKMPKDIKN